MGKNTFGYAPVYYEISTESETLEGSGIIGMLNGEDYRITVVGKGITRIISEKDPGLDRIKIYAIRQTCDEYVDFLFDIVDGNCGFIVVPEGHRESFRVTQENR